MIKILILSLFALNTYAQQATEIDPKSVRLPRYNNLTAIQAAITSPQQGMMVYNISTTTNWYYNGSNWTNLATAISAPTEADGFGSWGCANASLIAYQPVGNFEGKNDDYFGHTSAISGDYAIVGAYADDEVGFINNGSATIFKRNNGTGAWESQGKLTNAGPTNYEGFGTSVAISGNYAIVGAFDDNEGIGLSGNGSATIYKRNGGSGAWESQGKITNPTAANNDNFGVAVAISGDYSIVGDNYDSEGGLTQNGSATIFKRNSLSGIWESQGKLINPAAANYDAFGFSVAISGDYAIVGAYGDDEGIGLLDNGSATIFKRNSGSGAWESQGKLTNTVAANTDYFGISVAISGDYAIVGAYLDDEGGFTENGSATIFKRNSGTGVWESQGKLTNSAAANDDNFGYSVGISGDYAIVGARNDDEGGFTNNGSATIYRRYGNVWRILPKTTDTSAANSDSFGFSVAIDGNTSRFLIGARGTSSNNGLAVFGQVK